MLTWGVDNIQNGYQEAIRKLLLHNSVKLQSKNKFEWSGKFLQKGNLQSLDEYCDNAKRPDVKLGHYMNTKIGDWLPWPKINTVGGPL